MYRPDKYRPRNRMSVAYDILRLPRVARPLRAVGFAVLLLLVLPYAITPFYAAVEPVSTVMLWRRATGERVERQYVPLSRISPALPLAVIIAEDGRFCSHHGVDFQEIRGALADADDLDDLRGGSTDRPASPRCIPGSTAYRSIRSRRRISSCGCATNPASR